MNVSKINQSPIAKEMYQLKFRQYSNILTGNAREAKKYSRSFAKMAVENFETALQIPSPIKGSIPLFSRMGFNIIKYMIYNLFTRDSKEEKQLKILWEDYKYKQ